MRRGRFWIRLGVGLAAALALLVLAAWLGTRTRYAADLIAGKLAVAVGLPVQVGTLDVGASDTSLRGLALLEAGASPGSEPWVKVRQVDADVSLAGLLTGNATPSNVLLRDASVILRFDKDGHLLTKLPSPAGPPPKTLPTIRVEGGELTIRREGQPDRTFHGLRIAGRTEGSQLALGGSINDPTWRDWDVTGSYAPTAKAAALRLTAKQLHVTPALLKEVPFVPASVWEQVQLEGDTPVELSLRFEPDKEPPVGYRVVCEPRSTWLHISSIDLTAEQAHGKVTVEDQVVTLADVSGWTADGNLLVSKAQLDFRAPETTMHFEIDARGLELHKLPPKWKLPPLVGGRLTGKADLTVTVTDGRAHTEGQGDGTINPATFGGFSVQPILLKMHSAGGQGFRFESDQQPAKKPDQKPEPGNQQGAAPRPTAAALALLVGLVQPAAETPPDKPATSYIDVNLGLKDVELSELIKRLNVTLPLTVSGPLTFQVKASIPFDNPRDLALYRLTGTARMPHLTLEGLRLEEVAARVEYDHAVLRLEELSGRVHDPTSPAGTFRGTARMGIAPGGETSAQLTLERLPVGQLLRAVPGAPADAGGGTANGAVNVRVATADLRDPTKWSGDGNLSVDKLRAFGRSAESIAAKLALGGGALTLTEAKAKLEGAEVSATGELKLTDPYRYRARVALPPGELKAWQAVAPELAAYRVTGTARADATLAGTLKPPTVQIGGDATVDDFGLEGFKVGALSFRYDADADRLRLTDLRAGLYGGELKGTATLPLKPSVAGRIDLELRDLNTGNLTGDVRQSPLRLEGKATGSVKVDLPAAPPGQERAVTGDIQLQAERLRVQNIPADKLRASVTYKGGVADYRVEGDTLGGKFELNGQWPQRPAAQPPGGGRLRVTGIQLGALVDALRIDALRPLRGRVAEISLDTHFDADGVPAGTGRFVVNDLRFGDTVWSDDFRGELRLSGVELRALNLSGRVANGVLRGTVAYNLRQPGRSFLNLTLEQADAERLTAAFTARKPIEGPVDIHVRARLGREVDGSGQVQLGHGKLLGLQVSDAHFPLDFAFAVGSRGRLNVRDATGQLARGRLGGQATLTWGEERVLSGVVRFVNVDLRQFLSQFTEQTQYASGLATGRATFGGRDLHAPEDYTATIEATLAEAQAFQMPVLRQIAPFVMPGQSANTTFRSGDLRMTLARGIFTVQRLALVGNYARVFIDGTVTLSERLNLSVVANTRQLGVDPALLRIVGLSALAAGPLPLVAIERASNYLSNRTIRLRVGGTIRSPTVQVNVARLLTEEAVRFFISQANLPVPASVVP